MDKWDVGQALKIKPRTQPMLHQHEPWVQPRSVSGMWIKEQKKDTNRHKGTKQVGEVEKGKPDDCQDDSTTRQVNLQSA
uniref:Uncharacterized protein n=1 Tax=Solanum tuberosum TaxID=4113 RepID=M1DTX2_SOLTU